ncbi:MAG: prolipoprotein diacylglyceryl transferase [Proteobacteria bacterium]|jgi:phosphatidylglycerol:prolipoprotein diacylglycerol transferase|nr:prolipoprotein diacylglyceryl transferase [Pseudomonadota bacterium]
MLMYPHLNPVAVSLGPIKIHWYGIMYVLGFLFFIYAGKWRLKKYGNIFWTNKLIDDFIFYGALGVVLGGRLGYCLFYQPAFYFAHPLSILKVWDGGMAFHGGMLGVILVMYLFAKFNRAGFFIVSDFTVLLVPMGLFFGRMGNFINGELWGRFTTTVLPWAMVFPQSGSMLPRHPSQLYEALGEGLLLTLILWVYASKARKSGQVSGLFVMGYGIIRFCLEYFRQPDVFLTDLVQNTGLSMGQWLCIPMIIVGAIIFIYASKCSAIPSVINNKIKKPKKK